MKFTEKGSQILTKFNMGQQIQIRLPTAEALMHTKCGYWNDLKSISSRNRSLSAQKQLYKKDEDSLEK